jgi:CRP-like cAMP-binding protein
VAANIRVLKDRAVELMGKRRFDKAAQAYAQLCELDPKDAALKHRLGDALRAAGKPQEAVTAYRHAADRYGADGMLLKAIAVCKVILEIDPKHTQTQERLAALHAKRASDAAAKAAPVVPDASEAPLTESSFEELPNLAVEESAPESEESIEVVLPEDEQPDEELIIVRDEAQDEQIDEAPDEEVEEEAPVSPTPAAAEMRQDRPAAPLLVSTPLFEALEPDAFVALLQGCIRRPFKDGDVLIRQGDMAGSFFVLAEGRVRVVREVEDPAANREVELATLSEGAFFGELALLTSGPRFASVIGAGEGEALEFPSPMLEELQRAHPPVAEVLNRFAQARMLQNALATSPLFRPFDWENRKLLINRFLQRDVPSGEVILQEGKGGDGLYVILQGRMRVTHGDATLAVLHEGDVFGEISLLNRGSATATVTAEGPAKLLRLPREAFLELISTHPQALEVISEIAEQRQQTNEALLSGAIAYDVEGLMLV